MNNQLNSVASRLVPTLYCVSVPLFFWPVGWPKLAVMALPWFLAALWLQQERNLTLYLRGYRNADVDRFLARAAEALEPATRLMWIRNDLSPLELVRQRPLSRLARIYVFGFWPLLLLLVLPHFVLEDEAKRWADAAIAVAFCMVAAWLTLLAMRGGRAEHLPAFLVSSGVLFATWHVLAVLCGSDLYADMAGRQVIQLLAAGLVVPLHFAVAPAIRRGGEQYRLPWFLDRAVRNEADLQRLRKELRRAKEGVPNLFPRYLENAPVLGHQVGCTCDTWVRAVEGALEFVDVVVLDITDLRFGSELEKEIAMCRRARAALVLTCESSKLRKSAKLAHRVLDRQPAGIVRWTVGEGGRIQFSGEELRDVFYQALRQGKGGH